MDKSEYRVHQTHCCVIHGCKYCDDDCPVVNEEITQTYLCEFCRDDGIKSVEQIPEVAEFRRYRDKQLLERLMDICFQQGKHERFASKEEIEKRSKIEAEILRRMRQY